MNEDSNLLASNGGHIILSKHWGKHLLSHMGFVKGRANTKAKITVEDFEAVKAQFLIDIKAVVEFDEIPHELIINWLFIMFHGLWKKKGVSELKLWGWMISGKLQLYLQDLLQETTSLPSLYTKALPNVAFQQSSFPQNGTLHTAITTGQMSKQ